MKLVGVSLLAVVSLMTTNCTFENLSETKENWNETSFPQEVDPNDPKFLVPNAVREFSRLPLSSKLDEEHVPWSESYFPNVFGGVARRWQQPEANPWEYASPTKQELTSMSESEIRKLSPVEKLDIYLSRYNYPLLREERNRVKTTDPLWAGLCNGWTAVSLALAEPNAVIVRNKDGISIPFGSSDIKAIYMLNQDLALIRKHNAASFIGVSCSLSKFDKNFKEDKNCTDINSGAFHIALTNLLGLQKKGFVIDLERDYQVWNQPVFGYVSTIKSKQSTPTGSKITIATVIDYVSESGNNFYPVKDTPNQRLKTESYEYTVDLNTEGLIVGGDWISDVRPDFAWFEPLAKLEPEFQGIDEVYDASLGPNHIESPLTGR